MADEKLTREDCLALLRGTRERLLREGIDRWHCFSLSNDKRFAGLPFE